MAESKVVLTAELNRKIDKVADQIIDDRLYKSIVPVLKTRKEYAQNIRSARTEQELQIALNAYIYCNELIKKGLAI